MFEDGHGFSQQGGYGFPSTRRDSRPYPEEEADITENDQKDQVKPRLPASALAALNSMREGRTAQAQRKTQ